MLVLTRRAGEETVLILPDGQQIVVRVLEWKGGQARLGFDAPAAVRVLRRELINDNVNRKD